MQPKLLTTKKLALELNQHRLALAIKFSAITVVIIALYAQDLNLVFSDALRDESTFHILVIPILFAYLIFRKRKMLNASVTQIKTGTQGLHKHFSTIAGVLLSVTAVLVYWYGSYSFTPLDYHIITLPLFTTGLVLIFFNTQTLKQLIFPIAFLFFLTPPPSEILYYVGSMLANLAASASNSLANVFGIHTVLTSEYGNPLITLTRPDQTQMAFSVNIACSGIYSLIGFTIFAVFIAYITRGKLRNKLSMLFMGVPLIIALNIIRITIILAIGNSYGEAIALEIFHIVGATALMFIGTLILLAISEKAFKNPNHQNPAQPAAKPQ